jgi:hypothetical protein
MAPHRLWRPLQGDNPYDSRLTEDTSIGIHVWLMYEVEFPEVERVVSRVLPHSHERRYQTEELDLE